MKCLILVAVILHLAGTLTEVNGVSAASRYKFGDIISFPREMRCPCRVFIYKHFAIYVGREHIRNKGPGQDIFHRTRTANGDPSCIFGELRNEPTHSLDNYLDSKVRPGNHQTILARINEKKNNCGSYNLIRNNCEHLATYVRYGIRRTEQRDTIAARFNWICSNDAITTGGQIELPEDLEAFSCEDLCSTMQNRGSG